jgi:acetoin utilization protein AcuB
MNVATHMSRNPLSVQGDTPVSVARDLMKKEKIHRLPVVDKQGHVIGIVTEKDILYASPSPASTLDVYEIHSLLAKLTVDKVMTKNPLTVNADLPLEEAARIMADNNISGLPVTENRILTGIITESDLFRIFVDLFSIRRQGIRVTALIPDEKGELAKLTRAIFENGGNIVSFGTAPGDTPVSILAIFKVQEISESSLKECIKPFVLEIRDIRSLEGL